MAKKKIKSYGEQRAGEHFGLLSNADIKMKAFFALIMEDVYPQLDTTWEISLIKRIKNNESCLQRMEENLQKAGELTLERSRAMICKCHVKEV